jgi:hypothetical protein
MLVAAIDPGLLTGAAFVQFDSPEGCTLATAKELTFAEVMPWCETFLPMVEHVVSERFIITKKTISNTQSPWSLEVQGVVRAVGLLSGLDLQLQAPADAMKTLYNSMLKRHELWYRGGEGHANDAIRHAVTYAIRRGWRDPRLLPSDS